MALTLGVLVCSMTLGPLVHTQAGSSPGVARTTGQGRLSGHLVGTVDMAAVPKASEGRSVGASVALPLLTGNTAKAWAAKKAAAAHNTVSAPAPRVGGQGTPPREAAGVDTPGATANFNGMRNSATTCPYFGGCAPPDMALASNGKFVLQSVNTSIAVYKPTGGLITGFPKNLQTFFGVPNPSPSGCDSRGPFLSDPRAAWDPNALRWYVSVMQVEGAFGKGVGCTFNSSVWLAVSTTASPTGSYFVYNFGIPTASATNVGDYTQFGFDTQGLYWSYNMFNNAGSVFQSNVIIGIRKAELLVGAGFSGWFFNGLNVGGTAVDTIQPVESLGRKAGPQSEFFVNSFNFNFGGGNCASGCSGLVVWSFSNIAFQGGNNPILSGLVISSAGYSLPPFADDPPTCNTCLETLDTRISATPMYQHGHIYAALGTAVNNGSIQPGLLWFDVVAYLNPSTTSGCGLCTTINGSTALGQQGYYFYGGDRDAYFPTIAPDAEGNLFMGFEYSSGQDGFDPSQVYVSRRVTLPPGQMSDNGLFAFASTTASVQFRQGDYTASSWTGFGNDQNWTAGEYSCTGGDWCTRIWRNAYGISQN